MATSDFSTLPQLMYCGIEQKYCVLTPSHLEARITGVHVYYFPRYQSVTNFCITTFQDIRVLQTNAIVPDVDFLVFRSLAQSMCIHFPARPQIGDCRYIALVSYTATLLATHMHCQALSVGNTATLECEMATSFISRLPQLAYCPTIACQYQ